MTRQLRYVFLLWGTMMITVIGCSEDDQDPGDFESNVSVNGEDADVGGSDVGTEDVGDHDAGAGDEDVNDEINDEANHELLPGRAAVVGYSWLDRPIVAEWYGESGPLLYILSAIHGSERSAVTSGERLRTLLQGGLAQRKNVQIVLLPATNPDGIDLNRNFPASNFGPGVGGFEPLSEPETVAIHDTIEALMPTAILSIHCCIPTMDWDGPGDELAQLMADASGFPTEQLGAANGSLGSWAGVDLQIPTITVEFATQEEQETHDQLQLVESAISAAADWTHDNGPDFDLSIAEAIDNIDSGDFASFAIGISAGGLPLRAERVGANEEPRVLFVSGAANNDQRALFVAEHIRRIVHSEIYGFSNSLFLATAPNPDGIANMNSLTADNIDFATDFESFESPEARGLSAFIEARELELVIVAEATEGADGVTLFGIDESAVAPSIDSTLTIEVGDDDALDEATFIGWLRARDIAVVRLDVNTLFAMGDTREDETFDDIEVFSLSVLGLLNDLKRKTI